MPRICGDTRIYLVKSGLPLYGEDRGRREEHLLTEGGEEDGRAAEDPRGGAGGSRERRGAVGEGEGGATGEEEGGGALPHGERRGRVGAAAEGRTGGRLRKRGGSEGGGCTLPMGAFSTWPFLFSFSHLGVSHLGNQLSRNID